MDPELLRGPSAVAARLASQIERVSSTPRTTVLLCGERGRELELSARAIHAASGGKRASSPFVRLAGARLRDLAGPFDQAEDGTLFLEEIADLGPAQQSELLELLEERAGHEERVDGPRLIASTAVDLEREVERGRFREDLFYRLNVLTIRVPPLRQRLEDLEVLCERLLESLRSTLGVAFRLDAEALALLRSHGWPGGLLELESVLGCAAVACAPGERIGAGHLHGFLEDRSRGDALVPQPPRPIAGRTLRDLEEAAIRQVLVEVGGNRSRAARTLGINRTTLYNKLRLYGIA